jgi:hypothetical protein
MSLFKHIIDVINKNKNSYSPVCFILQFDDDVSIDIIDKFIEKCRIPFIHRNTELNSIFERVCPNSKTLYSTSIFREDLVVKNIVKIIMNLQLSYGTKISYYLSSPYDTEISYYLSNP